MLPASSLFLRDASCSMSVSLLLSKILMTWWTIHEPFPHEYHGQKSVGKRASANMLVLKQLLWKQDLFDLKIESICSLECFDCLWLLLKGSDLPRSTKDTTSSLASASSSARAFCAASACGFDASYPWERTKKRKFPVVLISRVFAVCLCNNWNYNFIFHIHIYIYIYNRFLRAKL